MAVTFSEERKKQKNLIIVAVVVVLITLIILGQWLIRKSLAKINVNQAPPTQFQTVIIDFKVLESPVLEALLPFEIIKVDEGQKTGRDNPFLPY
jgi:cytochrome oxidase assembly protein ShyY1